MPNAKLLLILNESISKDFQTPFENLGYRIVDKISDGKHALHRITELRPDLVLISIHLNGELGGISVGKQIYDQYDLPVIYISDQSSQTTIQRSRGTAPFGYLFGHEDEKQIMATIEVALTRHSMEKKVRESEQWLNAILHSIGEGVIVVDNEQCVRFINPVAQALTGKRSVDALGKHIEDVLSLFYANSQERFKLHPAINFLKDQYVRRGIEAVLIREDNAKVPVEVFVSPLSEKDDHIGMVLAFQDISERKRALDEIQKHATRTEAMLRAAKRLSARLDIKAILDTVCEICNNSIKTNATSAFLLDSQKNILKDISIAVQLPDLIDYTPDGRYEIPVELFENFLKESKPVVSIDDVQDLDIPDMPYLDKIKEYDVRSVAISGMYHNNALIGVLLAHSFEMIRIFTQDELDLLRGLADQASIALGNAILFEQVAASRQRQEALTRRLVDLREDERRNLAHELHDQLGQMMTGLQFSLNSLLAQATETQKVIITDSQEQVKNLIVQTREISMNLHPSMLDDIGLILTLLWHFNRFTTQTDIKVNFSHYNILEKRFDTAIEIAIFRIIQEALTNVARYALTDSVDVMLQLEDEIFILEINDLGQGFDLSEVDNTSHMGLNSMRERAYSVGGMLKVETEPAKGTRIQALIPLEGKVERRQYDRHRSAR